MPSTRRKGRRARRGAQAHCRHCWRAEAAGPFARRASQNGSRARAKPPILAAKSASVSNVMTDTTTKTAEPVTIKKYANRRLYNTGTSTYVTLEDLAAMVKKGEDFVVYDAKTGEEITRSVLDPDHFRAGEQGRAESAADRLSAPAHPFLRRQHADAGAALPRSLDRVADPRAGKIPQSDGAGFRRRRFHLA